MDIELKTQLDEIHALVKDNHRMLRAIRRDQWFGFVGKIVFWAVMIWAPFYLYQTYIAPMVTQMSSAQAGATQTLSSLLAPFADLQKMIQSPKEK